MAANDMSYIPTKFSVTYRNLANGSTQEREWVELARPGDQFRSTTWVEITEKTKSREDWDKIEPYYDAWKKGNAAPVNGTPLGAWPSITQEEAAAFKAVGLQSVEDVAGMSDRVRGMVRLPNVLRLKEEAGLFLKAKDQRGVELQLQAQAEKIAALEAMLAEQNEGEAPKRRGRPPKVREDAEEIQEEAA